MTDRDDRIDAQPMIDRAMDTMMASVDTAIERGLSRAAAYRQKRQQGTEWTAPSGMPILIRDLDISDHMVVNQFPEYLRKMVYDTIEHSAALRTESEDEEGFNPLQGLDGEEIARREYEISVTLCKLGWIDPQVVDEVTDEDRQIAVSDLDPRDRRAFMARVFTGAEQEAAQLSSFRDGSGGDVGPVPAVPGVPGDAVGADATGGVGVLRSDSV